jgi:hypothetical protein
MTVRITSTRRVVCEAAIQLPITAGAAWGQLRDLRSSARHDPFHSRICIYGDVPRAGAFLRIEHRYLLIRIVRIGRILKWRERSGFAFSDLCRTNSARAFPHVISYRVEPIDKASCVVHIKVGGRWTLPGPRWMGRIWLWWIFSHQVRTARNALLRFALAIAS